MLLLEKEIFVYGLVISIGSAVLSIQGFLMAFVGELFRVIVVGLDSSVATLGLVVNIFRNEMLDLIIGSLLLDSSSRVSVGTKVNGTGTLLKMIIGDFAVSSIIHPLASYVVSTHLIDAQYSWVVEAQAPSIISRQSVFEPLQTGILVIDAIIPIGRGQRELVVGDRGLGKTSIGLDVILNQKHEKVFCVYSAIGLKASSVLDVFLALVKRDAVYYLSIVVSCASSSALSQFLCAYVAAGLSEFFMLARQLAVFVIFDDLSKHAVSAREIYLLLRRPPGREAYPGEIFFVHSRLLERSAKLSSSLGGGSCSAFPVIETLSSDVSAYISTNVISITDGQLFLSQQLYLSSSLPAVDLTLSVTRVGSSAQWLGMKLLAGSYKLEISQYVELEAFSQFLTDCSKETLARLARGTRILEMLKQQAGSPINLRQEIGILALASHGLLLSDIVPVSSVRRYLMLYLQIPLWVNLFVSIRTVGQAIIQAQA